MNFGHSWRFGASNKMGTQGAAPSHTPITNVAGQTIQTVGGQDIKVVGS